MGMRGRITFRPQIRPALKVVDEGADPHGFRRSFGARNVFRVHGGSGILVLGATQLDEVTSIS